MPPLIHGLLPLLMALQVVGQPATGSGVWEKVYEVTDAGSWLTAVAATSADVWFVAGKGFIAGRTVRGMETATFPGRVIHSFGHDAAGHLYAVGYDELILRRAEAGWVSEHQTALPAGKRSSRRADDLLQGLQELDLSHASRLVAFGPTLVLVRQSDGSWTRLQGDERKRVAALGNVGPEMPLPRGCTMSGWLWLARDTGWFECQDRRTFLVASGLATYKGRLPSACHTAIDAWSYRGADLFVSCAGSQLWTTRGETWQRLQVPRELRGIRSISSTPDNCLFIAGRKTLWRRCGGRPDSDLPLSPGTTFTH